jgi:transitional endoplasmic reticulum ATPase
MPATSPPLSRFRSAFQRLTALWILRALSCDTGYRSAFCQTRESGYENDEIASFLGLPRRAGKGADPVAVGAFLERLRVALENDPRPKALPERLRANLERFGEALSLNEVERCILAHFILVKVNPILSEAWASIEELELKLGTRLIAKVLGLPRVSVDTALAPRGAIGKCRLLETWTRGRRVRYSFAVQRIAAHLAGERYDPEVILGEYQVHQAPPPNLSLRSFPHLAEPLELLVGYLRQAVRERRTGINLLLHGVPGTGKTQLTRVLGRILGIPVYGIDLSGEDGGAGSAADRLKSLELANRTLPDRPALLVFDEAEDVFGAGLFERSAASAHKGWFNSMLERNRWPVFWISNQVRGLDPAFVRRFDFILEVPVAPKSERLKLAEATVGDLVGQPLIERIASEPSIAPAVLSRLGSVVRTAAESAPRERREAHLLRLLGTTLKVQGHDDPFSRGAETRSCGEFDPALLNTPQDLGAIARRLREGGSARLCLHGPPGTGKSAFGRWLATELERPLLAKRASDLLGRYVGESERRIGEAFEEAAREGAVLLLDEVDSFLGTRESMRHSWEVTCVNEMLTRIEVFNGVLVCSTNRLEALDPASLRRFDLKVEFDYLRADQVEALLVSQCRLLGLPEPGTGLREEARRLRGATPGDFAAVARRHRFDPLASGEALLAAVREEIGHRDPVRASIGFAGLERLS